ncbi:MAG: flagellar hook-associated protein FlgK [Ramlibacter sp.]
MTSSLLNIGSRSLAAAQGSLGTIAHNIANANTAGYSRQEAVLQTAGGMYTGAGFFGRGVEMTTVRRQYDQFLAASVQTGASRAAFDAARAGALDGLDAVFADPELGIGAAVDAMFAAAGDVVNRPGELAARQAFLSRASQLAQRIGTVGAQLKSLGQEANARIGGSAGLINKQLGEIRTLNERIAQAQVSGQPPNDLLDQRDAALQVLNGLLPVNSVAAADGSLSLFTASGAALLVGNQQASVTAIADPADTTRTALQLSRGGVAQVLDVDALGSGSVAGLMHFRDQDLASAITQVGRLAIVAADQLNRQQARGVDASGVQGQPLLAVPAPVVRGNTTNTGAATLGATVADASVLKASDYEVRWDGSAYNVTRLADGQQTTGLTFPTVIDGLNFTAAGAPANGDTFLVQPFTAAATGLTARALSPSQLATGYAAVAEASATNKGTGAITGFAVLQHSADTALPVTISFNNPPTTFNVTGLASGNLTNVPYTAGQTIPPAPASYNGWSLVLDGAAVAGDSFTVKPNTAPGADNRNALALGALADAAGVDGATLNEAFAALVGDAGVRVQGARDGAAVSQQMQADATARLQSVSGVNLDEEAANLLRYQQAYQASAKIIQASQTLFDALLSATGR